MAKLAAATALPFLLCCFAAIATCRKVTFSEQYWSFDRNFDDVAVVLKPATINNDALQVTPDSAQQGFSIDDSGRILLRERFKLWEGDEPIGSANATATATARLASFNTSFLINIYWANDTAFAGEGLAFVIAPDLNLPANSSGQYLGLTNATTDGRPENKVVAVEFDTYKQSYDPDNNHVGIDVNSVRSVKNASLTPHNITLVSGGTDPKFFNVWIDYDGVGQALDVYIVEQLGQYAPTPPKPGSPILSHNINLMNYTKQYSYLGFSASTGINTTQLNCVLRWNLTVHHFGEKQTNWVAVGLGAGIPGLVLALIVVAGVGYYCYKRRLVQSNPLMIQALKSLPGTPREYEFKDLKKATNSFNDGNKLGEGGYGVVYRGVVPKEGTEIAVKCFSRESMKGEGDFLAELTIINRLRHKHLVKLLGWCHKNGKLLLVYDYMPNGSLDKHLFVGADVIPLSWGLRYKIITGVASALHYLHNEFEQRVVHRDLKASNIMLDSNFNARLGDFGLARALENEKTSYAEAEGVLGTMGYIAPECFHTGKATQQSDIYAFGAVLLEVVCGRRPGAKNSGFQSLVDWVWYMHRDGRLIEVVDERLGDEYVAEEAQRLVLLGLACSHPTASERPRTQAILQMISGTIPVPHVPPFRPPFVWPSVGPMDLESNTGDTMSMSTSQYGSGWSQQCLSRESYTGNNDSSLV